MSMRVRALSMAAVLVAAMWNLGCGHYVCRDNFGASTCAPSPSGIGGTGGGGNATPTAFAFAGLSSGTGIESFTFSVAGKSFLATRNFTTAAAPTSGGGSLIVVQGKYLYATFPGTGLFNQIYGWTISATGGLTSLGTSPFTVATWTGSILGNFTTNPSGSLLFETDPGAALGQSTVHVFQVGSGGGLTEASGSPLLLPFSPGTMAMDGLGKYLYVLALPTSLSGAEIGAYSVTSTGVLSPVSGTPFAFPMSQVAGDASGNFLVGTTASSAGTDPHLYVFSIQQSGTTAGALAAATGSPFVTLFSPLAIAVQPTGGEFVYSFSLNQTTANPIEGYQLNATTGALTKVSGSPFTSFTAQRAQFDQTGTYLFGLFGNTLTGYQVPSNGALAPVASIVESWGTEIGIADVP